MLLSKSLFLTAAVAAVSVLATPSVNVYFGQTGVQSLRSYCDSDGFEYVTLAFVSSSPEMDPATGLPTTNFGGHCGADVYQVDGAVSRLLSGCSSMGSDVKYCQQKGKKVLLSIGGVWGPDPAHAYNVSSVANGQHFAEFLWKAFGPADASWTGPRPLDVSASEPVVLDGFDFDIEIKFPDQSGYIALISQLRQYISASGGRQLITGAPQCPLADEWFQMKDMITAAVFDKLWIQFYDNPGCDATGSGFNYDDWEAFLAATASKDAQLYIGLPGDASVSGYITPEAATALVAKYMDRPSFGGIMLWDVTLASNNAPGGLPFYETVNNFMCGSAPSSPSAAPPTPTTTTSTSFAASLPPTSPLGSAPIGTAIPSSNTEISSPAAVQTSPTSTAETTGTAPFGSSGPAMTTSTVYTTRTYTITSCPPHIPYCPGRGAVTTEVVPWYTTVCPVSALAKPTSGPAGGAKDLCPGGENCPGFFQPSNNSNSSSNSSSISSGNSTATATGTQAAQSVASTLVSKPAYSSYPVGYNATRPTYAYPTPSSAGGSSAGSGPGSSPVCQGGAACPSQVATAGAPPAVLSRIGWELFPAVLAVVSFLL